MRMLSRSRSSPWRASRSSIAPTMSPCTRSASVNARPQLGRAGQASDQRSAGSRSSPSRTPCPRNAAVMASRSSGADLAQDDDVLARHRIGVAAESARRSSRKAVRRRAASSSTMRPLAIGRPEVDLAVALLVPAPRWSGTLELRHPGRHGFERLAEILRQPLARPLLAALGDEVFETRVAAVGAVGVIAVERHHGGRGGEQILGRDEGDRRRKPRIGLRLVVRHAVPAAEQEVVPGQPLAVEQCHDRQVVGQDVDRVVVGDREADLEFARQIALAIQRIGRSALAAGSCHFSPSTQISW